MDWMLGVTPDLTGVELSNRTGNLKVIDLKDLSKAPLFRLHRTKRLSYEGLLSSWQIDDASNYMTALGARLPEGTANRHAVFSCQTESGIAVHVPAAVLMQAFFKPNHAVLPAAFTPAGIDRLCFMDFSESCPRLVIDDHSVAKHVSDVRFSINRRKPLLWLQISKSAKAAMHSVYENALQGSLSMSLPRGCIRAIFHGVLDGSHLYATKVGLLAITVPSEDSLSGKVEHIRFHAMVEKTRVPAASINDVEVPLRADGSVELTCDEWAIVKPMLLPKKGYVPSDDRLLQLLNAVLGKLASGLSWKKSVKDPYSMTDLTGAFRRWKTSGRLALILAHLAASRAAGS